MRRLFILLYIWSHYIDYYSFYLDTTIRIPILLLLLQDLPRTFPGHPALDEDGRNALRRLLTAYARHNPAVGYCQVLFSMSYDIDRSATSRSPT